MEGGTRSSCSPAAPPAKEIESSPARRMLQVAKPFLGSKAANQELAPCIQAKSQQQGSQDRQTVLGVFEGLQ